jgi:hypothetical protein
MEIYLEMLGAERHEIALALVSLVNGLLSSEMHIRKNAQNSAHRRQMIMWPISLHTTMAVVILLVMGLSPGGVMGLSPGGAVINIFIVNFNITAVTK